MTPPLFTRKNRIRLFGAALGLASLSWFVTDATNAADSSDGDSSAKYRKPTLGQVDPAAESMEPYRKPPASTLRRKLTRIQYAVTQNEDTEPAHQNRYWNNKRKGIYECIVCGQDLFSSSTKYKSGTGWPSFYAPLSSKSVGTKTDYFLFYPRTEVHCSRCDAHLGHVFNDGPKPTGKRYCMNSASLNFIEPKKDSADTDGEKADE